MRKKFKNYQDVREQINENQRLFNTERDRLSDPVQKAVDSTFDICHFLVDRLEIIDNKVSKNSKNSSMPPSSDDNKENKKPKKGGRGSGGQPGHKGSTLLMSDSPDEVVPHIPSGKCSCGKSLSSIDFQFKAKRQVYDIELLRKIIEHQVFEGKCSCGRCHSGTFPDGVRSSTQYGDKVQAFVSYLSKYHLIPFERLEEIMQDLFDLSLSQGTIDNICKRGQSKLQEEFEPEVKDALKQSKVNNADETPTRVNGERSHLHVLSNEALTYLFSHKTRGMKAVDEQGILKDFKGTLVHDCFSMYFNYGKDHAICNSHLLRELTFVEQKYKHRWASEAKVFLSDLNDLVNEHKEEKTVIDHIDCEMLADDFKEILERGRVEIAPHIVKSEGRKRRAQPPPVKLCNRLLKLQKEVLRFMWDFDIPFTNNQAERDLRMAKVHLKISGGFRSAQGAQVYALFRSYIGTIKKHKLKVFKGLADLFSPENHTLSQVFIKPT